MKLVSYFLPKSTQKSYGILNGNGVVDVGLRAGAKFPDLKAVLQAGALNAVAAFANNAADYAAEELDYLPVIENPGKLFCVGMNYADKRREFCETIDAPTLFVRFPDSLTGQGCPVLKPRSSEEFDYEGELAVVIGRHASCVSRDEALSYVAGYSCFMDGSARDMQYTWFTAGKNWVKTGAFGPYLVTTDEIPDPNELTIQTFLNGMMVQNDNTANMMRSVPELIEYISAFSPLSPGDVVITGSPGGVGKKRTPPLFMKHGDQIEVVIEKIGRLSNPINQAM
jgi:2-keto-4-pentenoate hydratase/2-oxohepta-3-ene-1,7-dioic acid hydratase in catechol pathway